MQQRIYLGDMETLDLINSATLSKLRPSQYNEHKRNVSEYVLQQTRLDGRSLHSKEITKLFDT